SIRVDRALPNDAGVSGLLVGTTRAAVLTLDRTQQQLGNVHDLERVRGLTGGLLLVDRITQHDLAERARGGDGVGVGGQRLVHPFGIDALTDPLFHPHASTTGTAAETTFLVAVHLLGLDT